MNQSKHYFLVVEDGSQWATPNGALSRAANMLYITSKTQETAIAELTAVLGFHITDVPRGS